MSTGRDLLGEVLRAAGRRSQPEREDYEIVFDTAMAAWQRTLRARQRRPRVFALAASIVAGVIAVGTFLYWMGGGSSHPIATAVVLHGTAALRSPRESEWHPIRLGESIPAGSRIRTGAMAGLALELPRGISARLDEQTELQIDSNRKLRLTSGSLYVDTGSAPASGAVQVETSLGTVTDVGTVFQVDAEPGSLRVRVREGLVRLEAASGPGLFQGAAGEEVQIDRRGSVRRGRLEPSHDAWAWAEALAPPPDVEGRSLLHFLAWVARQTGRRVRFEGPEAEAQAREVVLHGKTRDLTPLQALDVMLSTTDLEYVLATDGVIVIRRRPDHGD